MGFPLSKVRDSKTERSLTMGTKIQWLSWMNYIKQNQFVGEGGEFFVKASQICRPMFSLLIVWNLKT